MLCNVKIPIRQLKRFKYLFLNRVFAKNYRVGKAKLEKTLPFSLSISPLSLALQLTVLNEMINCGLQ